MTEIFGKMEEDANQVLKFMASNGLMANAKKTSFHMLNCKHESNAQVSLNIGGEIVQPERSATLLGVKFEDNQEWDNQIFGKGGVLSALNSRHYFIRRLMSHLSVQSIRKVVDGLFTSKIRYGPQLYGKVHLEAGDPKCEGFKSIQIAQNNMLRLLNRSKISDHVSIESTLKKFNVLSVNQLNAQIKLLEIWKSINIADYPLKVTQQSTEREGISTRADIRNKPVEIGRKDLTRKTCISDAVRVWNKAPIKVTTSLTVFKTKKEIKEFVRSLLI